jgi:hypothetical protein
MVILFGVGNEDNYVNKFYPGFAKGINALVEYVGNVRAPLTAAEIVACTKHVENFFGETKASGYYRFGPIMLVRGYRTKAELVKKCQAVTHKILYALVEYIDGIRDPLTPAEKLACIDHMRKAIAVTLQ